MYRDVDGAWCLVAVGRDGTAVLVDFNEPLKNEVDSSGSSAKDLFTWDSFEARSIGLHVWEGKIFYSEDDVDFAGSWRPASAAEIIRYARGVLCDRSSALAKDASQ